MLYSRMCVYMCMYLFKYKYISGKYIYIFGKDRQLYSRVTKIDTWEAKVTADQKQYHNQREQLELSPLSSNQKSQGL